MTLFMHTMTGWQVQTGNRLTRSPTLNAFRGLADAAPGDRAAKIRRIRNELDSTPPLTVGATPPQGP